MKNETKKLTKIRRLTGDFLERKLCPHCVIYKTCQNCGRSYHLACRLAKKCSDEINGNGFLCNVGTKCSNHLKTKREIRTHFTYCNEDKPTKMFDFSDDLIAHLNCEYQYMIDKIMHESD